MGIVNYYDASGTKLVRCMAGVSAAALIGTLAIVVCAWCGLRVTTSLYVSIGVWAVGPPIWFWFEYFYWWDNHGVDGRLDQLKHAQDVSRAIWVGTLTGLIAFAASDRFKENAKDAVNPDQTTQALAPSPHPYSRP